MADCCQGIVAFLPGSVDLIAHLLPLSFPLRR
jgi:hypothetical protein